MRKSQTLALLASLTLASACSKENTEPANPPPAGAPAADTANAEEPTPDVDAAAEDLQAMCTIMGEVLETEASADKVLENWAKRVAERELDGVAASLFKEKLEQVPPGERCALVSRAAAETSLGEGWTCPELCPVHDAVGVDVLEGVDMPAGFAPKVTPSKTALVLTTKVIRGPEGEVMTLEKGGFTPDDARKGDEKSLIVTPIVEALAPHKGGSLQIVADAGVPHKTLIEVVHSAQSAGVKEVTLLTARFEVPTGSGMRVGIPGFMKDPVGGVPLASGTPTVEKTARVVVTPKGFMIFDNEKVLPGSSDCPPLTLCNNETPTRFVHDGEPWAGAYHDWIGLYNAVKPLADAGATDLSLVFGADIPVSVIARTWTLLSHRLEVEEPITEETLESAKLRDDLEPLFERILFAVPVTP